MDGKERDELLIRVDERTKNLTEKFDDHLTAHKWYNRIGLSTLGSFAVGLGLWMIGKE